MLGSHPVYQYFARRYGLNIQSVQWEPDALPSDSDWEALTELVARHPAKWMLWEGAPLAETSARLRALGIETIVVAPYGNVQPEVDFMGQMNANIRELRTVIQ